MAIGLPSLLEGIELGWELVTSAFEPLNAGETFTARPFFHGEGTYRYVNKNDVTFFDQPAVFDYYDGEFSIAGSGEGAFFITSSSGVFSVASVGSHPVKTRFRYGSTGYFDGWFPPAYYKNNSYELSDIYIYINSDSPIHMYSQSLNIAFTAMNTGTDFVSIGNISGDGWNQLINDKVPLIVGNTYTYYEALDTYIDYFNDKYTDLDLNLTREDFPSEEDYLPQVPTTTTSSGCCNIDYGEIMSPSEFDDVLNSAEYDLEEIPTTFALDLPELPEETLPSGMLSLAGNMVNASYNYYDSLGLSGILIAVGVIVCVIRLLRGGR